MSLIGLISEFESISSDFVENDSNVMEENDNIRPFPLATDFKELRI